PGGLCEGRFRDVAGRGPGWRAHGPPGRQSYAGTADGEPVAFPAPSDRASLFAGSAGVGDVVCRRCRPVLEAVERGPGARAFFRVDTLFACSARIDGFG